METHQITSESEPKLSEETVRKLSALRNEPEWLLEQRLLAFEQFKLLPKPMFVYGLNVMGSLNVKWESINPLVSDACKQVTLLQRDDVVVEDLSVAATKFEDAVKPYLACPSSFNNKFEALQFAFWNRGLFIHVKENLSVSKPVQFVLESQGTDIDFLLVVAEKNSHATIIETLEDASGAPSAQMPTTELYSFKAENVEVVAKDNASVKFATVNKLNKPKCFITKKAAAFHNAKVDWIDIAIGSSAAKQEVATLLKGEGSSTRTLAALLTNNEQQLDIISKAVHAARNTKSVMIAKGALKGRSRVIYQGFTKIMPFASGSDGSQKMHLLLLSNEAKASPIPKLEIDNYDVRATHEASVGQIDEDKLFYLMSRALDESTAKKLVVEGFFEPLIKELGIGELQEELYAIISEKAA